MTVAKERASKPKPGSQGHSPWLWHMQTRGVVTPSDFLSDEEKERLSGPVITYSLPTDTPKEASRMQKSNAAEGETPALTREKMEALIKEGKSASQMAQIFGVSRGTINNKKRLWGLIRQTARHAQAEDKGAHVQLEVQDSLDAVQAEQLLKNIAAFVAANGGRYEISLRINKS